MTDPTPTPGDDEILEGANSDPTGGGPPPPGSVTRVTSDGRGVTQGAALDEGDGRRDRSPVPISTGPNARPRNESIASTASGLPNDTSASIDLDPAEEQAIERKIRDL